MIEQKDTSIIDYDIFRDINNRNKSMLNAELKFKIQGNILSEDVFCILVTNKQSKRVRIKDVVLDILNGKYFLSNSSILVNWNFKKCFTYRYLHHGSRKGIKGAIIPCSDDNSDFGKAFYATDNKQYALSSSLNIKKNNGFYYSLFCELEGLKVFSFDSDLEFWMLYTAYNRKYIKDIEQYSKLKEKIAKLEEYDVIIGLIADDRSAYAINSFLNNSMTFECLCRCVSYFNLGYQYVFRTQKACNKIQILNSYAVEGEEFRAVLHEYNIRIGTSSEIVKNIENEYGEIGRRIKTILKEYI